jgi:hypothetical protein
MRKIFIIATGMMVSLALQAQEKPRWMDEKYRDSDFPAQTYFSGFAYSELLENKSLQDMAQQVKTEAQTELSKKIRLQISSQTQSKIAAITANGRYSEDESFVSQSMLESNTEIVDVKTESYYDPKAKLVYAFAYVNRANLIAYYKNQILLYLNKMESALTTASELVQKGVKMKARKQCEEVIQHFATVAYAQGLLTAIDARADDSILQQQRSERLRNDLIQTLTDLENSIYVYVACKETVNDEEVTYIADKLPGLLTENDCQCNFTEVEDQADYVIKVEANLTRCNEAMGNMVFCYANSTVNLYNAHTQKMLKPKIDEAKGGGTNKNYTKAGEEAFTELAKKIAAKVTPMMKN